MNEEILNPEPPPLPPLKKDRDLERLENEFGELEGKVGFFTVAESLLKRPGRIVYEMRNGRAVTVMGWQLLVLVACLLVYGFTVGMYSWNQQLWIAPAKVIMGTLFSGLICLPSLFIFLSLSGADLTVKETTGLLVGMLSLMALLLLGFGPVSFVFSRSTESIAFIGILQLAFWSIALVYGLQFMHRAFSFITGRKKGHLGLWTGVFLLVALQMTTTLRPIIGVSDQFFDPEKKFFVTHWFETMGGDVDEVE